MTTLFASTRRIKPTNPRFAFGIQVPKGPRQVGYTASDAAEWAAMSADLEHARIDASARDYDDARRYSDGYAGC